MVYNKSFTIEIQDKIKDSVEELAERIKQIRQQQGVSAFKNIAVADFQVGSDRVEISKSLNFDNSVNSA